MDEILAVMGIIVKLVAFLAGVVGIIAAVSKITGGASQTGKPVSAQNRFVNSSGSLMPRPRQPNTYDSRELYHERNLNDRRSGYRQQRNEFASYNQLNARKITYNSYNVYNTYIVIKNHNG